MEKKKIVQLTSIPLIVGTLFYLIPKSILMLSWLDSGISSSYFFLLMPINLILIAISSLALFSFKKTKFNEDKLNSILVGNVIGLLIMPFWIYFIFGS